MVLVYQGREVTFTVVRLLDSVDNSNNMPIPSQWLQVGSDNLMPRLTTVRAKQANWKAVRH